MKQIAIIFIAACARSVSASGLESLEIFVRTVKTGRADFTQVVTSPPKQGQVPRVKTSTGTFEFARPSRFKFVYKKPFEQSIVADGQTLWLYDVDLNQVTARKQSQVLGSTPASLIANPGTASCKVFVWVFGWVTRWPIWRCWRFWTALASARC